MTFSALNLSSYKEGLASLIAILGKDPECQALLEKAKDFEIVVDKCETAHTDFANRRIVLDPSLFQEKVGGVYLQALESLLFEMANLSQEREFAALQGRVKQYTPDEFVESFEKIEHQSALKTKKIMRKLTPQKEWRDIAYIPEDFQTHYKVQQISGHSERIWKRNKQSFLDKIYCGNLGVAIPDDEKKYVLAYLDLTSKAKDQVASVADTAKNHLQRIMAYYSQESEKKSRGDLFSRVLEYCQALDKDYDSKQTTP